MTDKHLDDVLTPEQVRESLDRNDNDAHCGGRPPYFVGRDGHPELVVAPFLEWLRMIKQDPNCNAVLVRRAEKALEKATLPPSGQLPEPLGIVAGESGQISDEELEALEHEYSDDLSRDFLERIAPMSLNGYDAVTTPLLEAIAEDARLGSAGVMCLGEGGRPELVIIGSDAWFRLVELVPDPGSSDESSAEPRRTGRRSLPG